MNGDLCMAAKTCCIALEYRHILLISLKSFDSRGNFMTRLRKPKAAVASYNPALPMWWLSASILAVLALAALIFSSGAKAGATYDGSWKVVIITQTGTCDPAYSYPVRVTDGRVSYGGDGSFEISGHVADGGGVNVVIARGDQKASASGKLSASSGSGQWIGKSASTACSGRWEANRV